MIELIDKYPFFAFIIVIAALVCITTVLLRFMRVINVSRNGWPPPHLDADGDFKPEPEEEDEC